MSVRGDLIHGEILRNKGAQHVAANPASTERPAGRMVGLLQLRDSGTGLSGSRSPCLRSRQALPRQAAQSRRAWYARLLHEVDLRRTRRASPHPHRTSRCPREPAVKSVGKPDAGNPHVRFDERGRETGRCRMAQATAPFLDSTITLKMPVPPRQRNPASLLSFNVTAQLVCRPGHERPTRSTGRRSGTSGRACRRRHADSHRCRAIPPRA